MQKEQMNWQKKLRGMAWHKLALEDLDPVLDRHILPEGLFDSTNALLKGFDVSVYVDYDHNFFALFTLLQKDGQTFVLGQLPAGDDDESLALLKMNLKARHFYELLGLVEDAVLPLLQVYRAGFLFEIHRFLYQVLPILLSETTVYISQGVQEVFFAGDLPLKVDFAYDKSHRQLLLELILSDNFTSQDLLEIYREYLEDLEDSYYQTEDGSLYDLGEWKKQQLFFSLEELGWSELDIQRKKKIFPAHLTPQAIKSLEVDLPRSYRAYELADLTGLWRKIEDVQPLELNLPPSSQTWLVGRQKELLAGLARLYSAGFGGAVIFKNERQLHKLALFLAWLVQDQYKKSQALYLGSPAELAWLAEQAQELCPDLAIRLIQGPPQARRQLLGQTADSACLYLTSYTLFRNDLGFYENLKFDLVLLAASKRLDSESETARAIHQLKAGQIYVFGDLDLFDDKSLWSLASLVLAEHYRDEGQFFQDCEEDFYAVSQKLDHFFLEADYY